MNPRQKKMFAGKPHQAPLSNGALIWSQWRRRQWGPDIDLLVAPLKTRPHGTKYRCRCPPHYHTPRHKALTGPAPSYVPHHTSFQKSHLSFVREGLSAYASESTNIADPWCRASRNTFSEIFHTDKFDFATAIFLSAARPNRRYSPLDPWNIHRQPGHQDFAYALFDRGATESACTRMRGERHADRHHSPCRNCL